MKCETIITIVFIISFTAGFMFYLLMDTLRDTTRFISMERKKKDLKEVVENV